MDIIFVSKFLVEILKNIFEKNLYKQKFALYLHPETRIVPVRHKGGCSMLGAKR